MGNYSQSLLMRRVFLLFTIIAIVFIATVPAYATTVDPPPDITESGIIAFVKRLFVPSESYFTNQFQRLNDHFSEKMGGVGYLFSSINNFFVGLGNLSSSSFVFAVPDNYFFSGYKGFTFDLVSSGATYIKLLRDFFNVFISLLTAFCCYKKLVSFFE